MISDDPPAGFRQIEYQSDFVRRNGPIYQRDLDDDPEFGFVRAFRVTERHCNLARIVHGGMLATFADLVLGQACWRALAGPAVTVRLTCDYLAPARIGDWVEGRARVRRRARSLVFVQGDISARHRILLSAEGIFQPVTPRG